MSDLAKKLIEENLANKNPSLDLGNCGLTDASTCLELLADCTHLETLVLAASWKPITYNEVIEGPEEDEDDDIDSKNEGERNSLKMIPACLPTSLKTLILAGNSIASLENLNRLVNLEYIDLAYNNVEAIDVPLTLKNLKHLSLRYNGLTKIENLEDLTSLRRLELQDNQLTKLENLEALTQLWYLGLGFNKIEQIEGLATLSKLTYLDLSFNRTGQINNLEKLTSLTHLILDRNEITKLENLEALTQLKYLELFANDIAELENLDTLTQLIYLGLDRNHISNLAPLKALPQLKHLVLSRNKLTKIEHLETLTQLVELNLLENKIATIENLATLTELKKLDLNGNQLTKIENLETLTKLEVLEISSNKLGCIENLEALGQLTELDLGYNPIAKMEGLATLTNLETLTINRSQIAKIENLETLTKLKLLTLNNTNIAKIENLSTLAQLKELMLNNNQITKIENLETLTQLKELDLSNNQIAKIENLEELTKLEELDLSENKIARLEGLHSLQQLKELKLFKNQIVKIENLEELVALEILHLDDNCIAKIEGLEALKALLGLYLNGNKIKKIAGVAHLAKLETLYLNENQITLFDPVLLTLPTLSELYLEDNPWQNIPQDIANNGAYMSGALYDVQRYWEDVQKGKTKVYQAKLLLIGNGRVGKTSLVKRWLDNSFDPEQSSTHAIQLRRHVLPQVAQDEALEHVQLNVWDFGGQDIYHATHRLFMQTEAVFLLVWDAVTQAQPTQTETLADGSEVTYQNHPLLYWLDYAYTLGKQSPVLVAQTKSERDGVQTPPQLSDELKAHYQVQACLALDAAIGDQNKNGFKEVDTALQAILAQAIKRSCTDLPESWWHTQQAIEALQKQGQQTLAVEAFEAICHEHEVPQASYWVLRSYFHNSGVFFYRRDLFNNQIILNQQWAIDAVYTLFDRQGMFMRHRGNGFFTGADLSLSWQGKSRSEQELLLSFMESCELCIDIDRPLQKRVSYARKVLKERRYLAPQLLPDTSIDLPTELSSTNQGVYLKFCHPILHAAVIHRFILRTHHFAPHAHIRQQAILLTLGDAQALVQAFPENNELVIRINVPDASVLSQLRNELREVQGNTKKIEAWASVDGQGYVALDALAKQHTGQVIADNGEAYNRADFEVFLAWDKGARLGI
jgi:Leucine-rich repeat (LRR) protein/GTPase SAR1 family protein